MEAKKTCPSSKKRYENEDDANRAAREGMLFNGSPPLKSYFCLICLGYHLTSRIKEKQIKRKK